MRIDAQTLGTGAGSLIVGLLFGVFVLSRFVCNEDGNPVGFHLGGYVKLDQPASLTSCSNQQPCYLQIDMTFAPMAAPNVTPTPCAATTSCYSFSNVPPPNAPPTTQPTSIAIDYGHPGDPKSYTDYLYGVIQGSIKE